MMTEYLNSVNEILGSLLFKIAQWLPMHILQFSMHLSVCVQINTETSQQI